MSFQWPELLWGLALLPLLVAAYAWLQRRRKRLALRYANLSLVREALDSGPGWRRHVPPGLILVAIATMIVAMRGPDDPRLHSLAANDFGGESRATRT